MKKLFTLIAFAIAALTASANTAVDFPSSWGSTCTVSGTTYSFNGSWAGAGSWLGNYDATGNDYVVCTFENHTGGVVNFGICYNKITGHESWGDVYATTTIAIDQAKGHVAIALDKESISDNSKPYIQDIRQVQIQDAGEAASVTITGIYFMTADEYASIDAPTEGVFKLEGINCGLPEDGVVAAWSWNQQQTNDSQAHQDEATGEWITDKEATYDYKDASGYDYIVVQFEKNDVGAHFFCVDNTWQKQVATDFVAGASYVAVDLATSEVGTFKDNIVCFVMQPLADGVLKIKEIDYMTAAAYQQFLESQKEKVYEKELGIPGDNGVITMPADGGSGWYTPGWIGQTNLNSLYKTLVFEVASADAHYQLIVQGSEDGSTWDESGFSKFNVAAHSEPAILALPVEGKHVNLGQYAFQNMNVVDSWMDPKTGEMVSEYADNKVVVTRAYLTSNEVQSSYTEYTEETAITEVSADAATSTRKAIKNGRIVISANGNNYNVAGQLVK